VLKYTIDLDFAEGDVLDGWKFLF